MQAGPGSRLKRRPSGLVDRLYADELGSDLEPLPVPSRPLSESHLPPRIQDPYAQEIGPGTGIMRGLDKWLTENVVEPSARAGYPNLGAAAATVPSTVADLVIPQTAADYAGMLLPFGKVGKALKGEAKLSEKLGGTLSKEEMAAKRAADNQSVLREMKRPGRMAEEESIIPQSAREKFNQRIQGPAKVEPELDATERALAKYGDEGDQYRQYIKDEAARTSEPYVGFDMASPAYRAKSSVPQPFPVSGVVDVKGHLGKTLGEGGPDPLAWLDTKYGASKKVLEANRNKPLKISTRSDLISHDDYISNLNPKLHEVEFHIPSTNSKLNKILTPGAPSISRQMAAIKKLQERGIKVSIVHENIKGLPAEAGGGFDALSLMRDHGVSVPVRSQEVVPDKRLWDALGDPDTFHGINKK